MKKILTIWILMWCIFSTHASYLLPQQAFQTSIMQLPNNKIAIHFNIAKGYEIYQDKIHISSNISSSTKLGNIVLPPGIEETNDIMGTYYVYKDTANIIATIIKAGTGTLIIDLNYQGCKGLEYCYPAISETKTVVLKTSQLNNTLTTNPDHNLHNTNIKSNLKSILYPSNTNDIVSFFNNSFFLVIIGFFVIGILLSASPCVFPMLPILFTIVAGQKAQLKQAIMLSVSYVLGIATAYALVGIIFATFGSNLQIIMQNNTTNYILAALFFIFSLSLFGLFEIRLPQSIQNKLTRKKKHTNTLLGTYIAGILSTIILSPCITAPLAGALLYIASTGNIILGGTSLFALGIGSGLPLIIIAVFGNKIFPKSGNWLFLIRDILAFVMLEMAIYIGTRNLQLQVTLLLTGILLITAATYFLLAKKYLHFKSKHLYIVSNIFIIFLAGYTISNQINKSNTTNLKNGNNTHNIFKHVTNIAELNQELAIAKTKNKVVMLDFSASWCIACKELASLTLANEKITSKLESFYLIEVDISNNDKNAQALMKKYNVIAPPTLIFIDKNGAVLNDKKILGYISSNQLLRILNSF